MAQLIRGEVGVVDGPAVVLREAQGDRGDGGAGAGYADEGAGLSQRDRGAVQEGVYVARDDGKFGGTGRVGGVADRGLLVL